MTQKKVTERLWGLIKGLTCLALVGGSGCVVAQQRGLDRVDPTPIATDDAMQLRNYPLSKARYPSLSQTTGSTEFLFAADPGLDSVGQGAADMPVFLSNIVALPVAMVLTPPWAGIRTVALAMPPTYTANPPQTPTGKYNFSGGPVPQPGMGPFSLLHPTEPTNLGQSLGTESPYGATGAPR